MAKYGEHITNPRRIGRLKTAVKWLEEEVPGLLHGGATFDLGVFSSFGGEDVPRTPAEARSCGFTGCAAGWLALCPNLRRKGLRLGAGGGRYEDNYNYSGEPFFGSDFGLDAYDLLAEFFGITCEASECVFGAQDDDWTYCSVRLPVAQLLDPHDPKDAAARLRRFCEDQGVAP